MNFRKRIITTFLLFATALSTAFGLLLDNSMAFVEDEITRDFLTENMRYFEEKLLKQSNPDLLISTPKLKAYLTHFGDAPKEYILLNDGFHETAFSNILVKTLGDGFYSGEKLILRFDESKSFLEQNESHIGLAIALFSLLIVALAGVVCLYLAKSIASPIEYLAEKVSSEQDDIFGCSALSRKDELGHLARAFSISVERERNFTRYASHELRTPLTVIKSNIDILQVVTERFKTAPVESGTLVPHQKLERSINRLDQAAWFMEQQINTLLLLARGKYKAKPSEVELASMLNGLESYFPHLTLNRQFDKDLHITADPTVLLSILTNILNNVTEHGADNNGNVMATIEASQFGISVTNATAGPTTENHSGDKFGLEIVRQLCEAMHWQLTLTDRKTENESLFSISVFYEN